MQAPPQALSSGTARDYCRNIKRQLPDQHVWYFFFRDRCALLHFVRSCNSNSASLTVKRINLTVRCCYSSSETDPTQLLSLSVLHPRFKQPPCSTMFTASKIQVATYLLGICPFSIAFLVFLNSSVSFVVTDLIGRETGVGDAVGNLGFADELLALVACPLWGLLSDKIGVRAVCSHPHLPRPSILTTITGLCYGLSDHCVGPDPVCPGPERLPTIAPRENILQRRRSCSVNYGYGHPPFHVICTPKSRC